MFERGTVATPQDREIALGYFARACRLEQQSCTRLAQFYEENRDYVPPAGGHLSRSLLALACDAGNKLACARKDELDSEVKRVKPPHL